MADIRFTVSVDDKGLAVIKKLEASLGDLEKQGLETGKAAEESSRSHAGLWKQFAVGQVAANVVMGALRRLKDIGKDSIAYATAQEDADRALRASLELTGRTVEGNYEHYKQFAEAQQLVTTYADNEIQTTQALLLQMTRLNREGVDKATKGAMGLASTLKIDLHSATMLVAKAMEGNFTALSRYGLKVDETLPLEEKRAQLLEKLRIMYGRATAETETYSGSIKQLKNVWGDALEEVGKAVTENKQVKETIAALTETIRKYIPELKEYIEGLTMLIGGVAKAVEATLKAVETVRERIGGLRASLSESEKAWESVSAKMGGFSNVVNSVNAQILRVGQHSKESREEAEALGKALWESFNAVGARATLAALAAGDFGKAGKAAFAVVGGEILKVAQQLSTTKTNVNEVGDAFADVTPPIEANLALLQDRAEALNDELRFLRSVGVNIDMAPAEKAFGGFAVLLGGAIFKTAAFREAVPGLFAEIKRGAETGVEVLTKLDIRKQIQALQTTLGIFGDSLPVSEITRLREEVKRLQEQLGETTGMDELRASLDEFATYANTAFAGFDSIFAQSQRNREIAIDNEYKKRLAAINANIADEEARQTAVMALEAEYQIKRTEAMRGAAKAAKAVALMSAIVNVHEAYTKALAQGGFFGGPVFAAIIAALGAVQVAAIAAQPIPLARGGVFKRRTRLTSDAGTTYDVAENEVEVVSPKSIIRQAVREELGGAGIAMGGEFHAHLTINTHGLADSDIERAGDKIFEVLERGARRRGWELNNG